LERSLSIVELAHAIYQPSTSHNVTRGFQGAFSKYASFAWDKKFGDVEVPCIFVSLQFLAIVQSIYFLASNLINV
jgi:hypothetical protein